MKKKLLALLMSVVMVMALFAACGTSDEDTVSTDPASSGSDAAAANETPAATEAPELEPVVLKMYLEGSNVTDDSAVLAEVNKYLTEKINATLEPIWGTWGDFDSNAVLSLQGGEDVDIYFTCSWTANEYNKFAADGYYVRLDDPSNNLIEKYASELWSSIPEVLTSGATITGSNGVGVYAIPGYKDIATQNCWDINVPLLTKYGYTVEDIMNTDYYGFGEILATVKAGEGADFYPLLVEGAVLERMVNSSIVVTGDSGTGNFMSYYLNPDDVTAAGNYGTTILNKYATDEFKKFAEKTREYYLAGYIDPACGNASQANDLRSAKQLTGEYLIGTQVYSLGYEKQASQERGFEVAMVPCTDAYVDTTSSQGAMMAISTASKNPERAVMFLNLLNTDPYLMTLLNYGVEGVHYELADGLVSFTEKRADYSPWTNGLGNVTILKPTVEQGADFWNTFKAYYGAAKEIPLLGFCFKQDSVTAEMGALSNVVAEYMLALCTGTVETADALPKFLEKLSDNGIDKVIAEANSQLTAFLAEKNK